MAFLKYAVYVLILACVVMLVRKYTTQKLDFHVSGFVKPGFEAVDETFRGLIKTHMDGGAFAAYYNGELVVDMWGGYADVEAKQQWERDTISIAFSSTKGIAALCVAVLVSRGYVTYMDPVSKFWPEFAQNGKENVTLLTLLNHKAGVAALDETLTAEEIATDSPKVAEVLAKQKPLWEPGRAVGYHALTFGLYCDQVVRRVDPKRRNITQFFEDELATPLGLDFSLRLKPEDRYRDTRLKHLAAYGLYDTISNAFETWDFTMIRFFYDMIRDPDSLAAKAGRSVRLSENFNNIHVKTVPISSYTGHGTARAIAKLYGLVALNGAVVNGKPLISEAVLPMFVLIPKYIRKDVVLKVRATFSAGLANMPAPTGDWMFGAPGYGGQFGFGDSRKKIGFGLLTNHLKIYNPSTDVRSQSLLNALYDSVKKIEAGRN